MIKKALLFLFIGLGQWMNAQIVSSQYLPFFKVQKIGNHINSQWRTGIDFTCNDVELYYGKDSTQLQPLYSYPGTCGTPKEEKDYHYLHDFAPKEILYYELRLGIYGKTNIQRIDNRESPAYLVYPNPVLNACKIEFAGVETGSFELSVFSYNGNKIWSTSLEVTAPKLDLGNLPSGIYYFTATFSHYGKVVNGKINKI